MKTGWQQMVIITYFGSDGSMRTGWLSAGEAQYYLHSDGSMAFEVRRLKSCSTSSEASNDGAMKTLAGIRFQMHATISDPAVQPLKAGRKSADYWYYFDKDGSYAYEGNHIVRWKELLS